MPGTDTPRLFQGAFRQLNKCFWWFLLICTWQEVITYQLLFTRTLRHWQRTKVSLFYFWKMNFWTRWIWRQGKRSLTHLWVSSCGLSPFAPDIMKITILRRESDVSGNQRNPKVLRRGRQSGGSIKRHWPFRGKRRILCAAWTVGVEFVKILFVDFLN